MENPLGDSAADKRDLQAVGIATGLGCTVVVSLLLCIGGGILLDRWLDTEPIFALVGVALGLVASGYTLYELAMLGVPDRGRFRVRSSGTRGHTEGGEGE